MGRRLALQMASVCTVLAIVGGCEVVPTPVPQSQFYIHDRGASIDQLRGLVREFVAVAVYWWRGWL